jgi:hypothetical protein
MNATLTTFYLIRKIKQGFFLYYISCKENKCWKGFKIMRKLLFNYSLYSHPEILGCDKSTPLKRNLVPGFEEEETRRREINKNIAAEVGRQL